MQVRRAGQRHGQRVVKVGGVALGPHRPAVDVEDALAWAFGRQLAGRALFGGGLGAPEETVVDSVLRVGRHVDLGVTVDTSARPQVAELHPDAELLGEALAALATKADGVGARLAVAHASAGSRPDWWPGAAVRCVAVLDDEGNPRLVRDRRGKPVLCVCRPALVVPVAGGGTVEREAEELGLIRGAYAAWWDALFDLAAWASDGGGAERLTALSIRPLPAAPRRPWEYVP